MEPEAFDHEAVRYRPHPPPPAARSPTRISRSCWPERRRPRRRIAHRRSARRKRSLPPNRRRDSTVTGVCAYNDEYAITVMAGAVDAGLAVPQDLAVIGVDDTPLADLVTPRLSSVRIDHSLLARTLARRIAKEAEAFGGEEFDEAVVVPRSST